MANSSYTLTKAKKEAEEFMRSRNSIEIKKEQTTREIVKFINDHYDYLYYNIIDKVLYSGSPDKNTIIYSKLNDFLKDLLKELSKYTEAENSWISLEKIG